ncbi:hypothetical protein ACIQ6U_21060 [Lysinibacillus fusiformis]|uniref:hypothetical protein n=1 Tax=Lysinibacillus fusiformis TaxID=28031 RepID=UPI003812E24D
MKPLYIPRLDQGREADLVYFIIGTGEQTEGAVDWTCSKPNLLNIAVTRAKQEFYVVGDIKRRVAYEGVKKAK